MTALTWHDTGAPATLGSIYCIGRNYARHAAELGNAAPSEPFGFLKARTTLRGLEPVPMASVPMEHETEVVVRVGRAVGLGSRVGWEVVDGITVGLDLTRRDVQRRCKERRLPWTPAKSFAGSALVAPLLRPEAVGDPDALAFWLDVHGVRRQTGRLADALFDVPTLLTWIASLSPLEAGDLVFTGTPEGVGPMAVGDPFVLGISSSSGQWRFTGVL